MYMSFPTENGEFDADIHDESIQRKVRKFVSSKTYTPDFVMMVEYERLKEKVNDRDEFLRYLKEVEQVA